MYYEHLMKELLKLVDKVDSLNVKNKSITETIKPYSKVFSGKSKDFKSKIDILSKEWVKHQENLLNGMNRTNKNTDWVKLLDFKLKMSKASVDRARLYRVYKESRKKHYNIINPYIKEKKQNNKDIKVATTEIFDRIRRK